MNKSTKLILGVLVAIGIALLLWGLQSSNTPVSTNHESIATDQTSAQSITLSIQDLWINEPLTISTDQTLLELLKELSQTKQELNLEVKEYQGLGTLITKLGNHTNGEQDAYWQFFVNGEQPLVGADVFVPKPGDKIEWKFAPSEM